jgi:hypothetical protein
MTTERYSRIVDAYEGTLVGRDEVALAGRDDGYVAHLLHSILDSVPDTNADEVANALQQSGMQGEATLEKAARMVHALRLALHARQQRQ